MPAGRPCSICNHEKLRDITADLMARLPYRKIQDRYSVTKSSLDRHLTGHVSDALRRLVAAESNSLAEAVATAEPVLMEMRKLNARSLRILQQAEASADHTLALNAIRECRRNLELIGKLTGELDPRASGEQQNAPLTVVVQYVDKQQVVAAPATAVIDGSTQEVV